jgi:hypothetical protein
MNPERTKGAAKGSKSVKVDILRTSPVLDTILVDSRRTQIDTSHLLIDIVASNSNIQIE